MSASYEAKLENGDYVHGVYGADWLPHVGEFVVLPTVDKATDRVLDRRYVVLRVEHSAYGAARLIVREVTS